MSTDGRDTPDNLSGQVNPALKLLDVLVGEWETEISNTSFLPNPSDTANILISFEWVQDGAFLLMRMGDKPPSPPNALWLIGRDDSASDYTVLYYDDRGVSRVYMMSFSEDRTWKMWREAPGFWQRYEGIVNPDGKSITARWEKSHDDGATWELDFHLVYTRAATAG